MDVDDFMLVTIFGVLWQNFYIGDVFECWCPTLMLKYRGCWWRHSQNRNQHLKVVSNIRHQHRCNLMKQSFYYSETNCFNLWFVNPLKIIWIETTDTMLNTVFKSSSSIETGILAVSRWSKISCDKLFYSHFA